MFKRELIEELRARGYRFRAWADYVRGHFELTLQRIEERPGAARSVIASALALLVLLFVFSLSLSILREDDLGRRIFGPGAVWLALHSVWIILHLGLLVDNAGRPVPRLGLPNALTLFRGITIPILVVLANSGQIQLFLGVYLAGALSDIADGGVARRFGPVTRLGLIMDPIVDIAWNGAAVFALTRADLLPGSCLVLIAVRYGLLMVGSVVLYLRNTTLRIRSTRFGKASGAVLASAVLLVLLNELAMPARSAAQVQELLELGVGLLLWGTIVHVLALGVVNFRRPAEAWEPVGRVVGQIQR